jgi:hypothetical protein
MPPFQHRAGCTFVRRMHPVRNDFSPHRVGNPCRSAAFTLRLHDLHIYVRPSVQRDSQTLASGLFVGAASAATTACTCTASTTTAGVATTTTTTAPAAATTATTRVAASATSATTIYMAATRGA